MATKTRQELKDYCLRRLGYPVIEINIDDAQIEDRIDDALELFAERHYDGAERTYLPKQLSQTDLTNRYIDLQAPTLAEGIVAAAPAMDPDGNSILSILKLFQLSSGLGAGSAGNLFDAKYQMALSDMFGLYSGGGSGFGMGGINQYDTVRRHMALIQDYLTPEKSIRFSKVTNKIYIDSDWAQFAVGDILLFEAYKILDANDYPEIYNDIFLRAYATALIKRQWGTNLSKYSGIALAGGVTLNGMQIYSEAIEEIKVLEEEMSLRYELPPSFEVG